LGKGGLLDLAQQLGAELVTGWERPNYFFGVRKKGGKLEGVQFIGSKRGRGITPGREASVKETIAQSRISIKDN